LTKVSHFYVEIAYLCIYFSTHFSISIIFMARQQRSSRARSRSSRRPRSRKSSSSTWKFIMTALLVVTLIAAISAYRNNHDSGSFYDSRAHGNDEYANSGKSSDNAAATVAHFNDLELARYTGWAGNYYDLRPTAKWHVQISSGPIRV